MLISWTVGRIRRVAVTVALPLLVAVTAGAQAGVNARVAQGSIAGEVVDAETLRPLSGATVVILAASPGVLPPPSARGSSFFSLARSMVTGELGVYRFTDLPFGDYQLRVQRVGYRPGTVDVQLRESDDARVSLGLTVAPVRLRALTVRAEQRLPYGSLATATEDESASRVAAARLRQRLFLGADVREVTHSDVVEAVTVGTTDLFRAFHRLPGVATRDEEAAELWTRGSRPDLTRVYFDGQPLFGPLHAFDLFSGVSASAVGAAFLHPGARPASIGEGAAAVVDVRSRPGGGDGRIRGVAELASNATELTPIAARLAVDQRLRDGHAAWMVSAGGSIFDRYGSDFFNGRPGFADVAGRVDYELSGGRRVEASGLWLGDFRRGAPSSYPFVVPTQLAWGNTAGRATLRWPIAGLRSQHTIGISRFAARIDTLAHDPPEAFPIFEEYPELEPPEADPPMRSTVLQAALSGQFEPPPRGAEPAPWAVGYELTNRRVEFDGDISHVLLAMKSSRTTDHWESPTISLWGTRRWRAGQRFVVEPGLRLDLGPAISNAGVLRPMPRLSARFAVDSQTALSAGIARSFQYTQAVGRIERGRESVSYPTPLWLAADDSIPALRADIANLGVERWLGEAWLVGANVYTRRSVGFMVRDPTPGVIRDGNLVAGQERASGAEVSARKLAGRVTGSASYSYAVARTSAAGFTFPSNQDRRHSFDFTMLARLRPWFHVSVAYTYTTGAPYTRLSAFAEPIQGFSSPNGPDSLVAQSPNALRKPAFGSLDVSFDWSFTVSGVRAGTFIQFRNALMRENPGLYYSYGCSGCSDGLLPSRSTNVLIPVLGLRARF